MARRRSQAERARSLRQRALEERIRQSQEAARAEFPLIDQAIQDERLDRMTDRMADAFGQTKKGKNVRKKANWNKGSKNYPNITGKDKSDIMKAAWYRHPAENYRDHEARQEVVGNEAKKIWEQIRNNGGFLPEGVRADARAADARPKKKPPPEVTRYKACSRMNRGEASSAAWDEVGDEWSRAYYDHLITQCGNAPPSIQQQRENRQRRKEQEKASGQRQKKKAAQRVRRARKRNIL